MRKPLALALALLSTVAFAQPGITLDDSTRYEFVDCALGGSAAQTVPEGRYLLRVTDADTTVCRAESASTCAAGGDKLPMGTVMVIGVQRNGRSFSCRSSGTGDLLLTKVL